MLNQNPKEILKYAPRIHEKDYRKHLEKLINGGIEE